MIKFKNYINMAIVALFWILTDLDSTYNCVDNNNMCSFNINVQGHQVNDGIYKFELNNSVYTTELGFGVITVGNTSLNCELILIYNEIYNNDYGLSPMLYDINDFVFYESKSREDTIFYILNINESNAETCPGYLIKNNVKYEFFLIIRYTDDIVSKLKELNMYPIIPKLSIVKNNLNITLLNPNIGLLNLEMSELLESNYLIWSTLMKLDKSRGKQPNFGIFLLTTEEYECGYVLVIKNKSDAWLREKDFILVKKNLMNASEKFNKKQSSDEIMTKNKKIQIPKWSSKKT